MCAQYVVCKAFRPHLADTAVPAQHGRKTKARLSLHAEFSEVVECTVLLRLKGLPNSSEKRNVLMVKA